ncbi:unnamed protein product [Lampetra fluviatilis]
MRGRRGPREDAEISRTPVVGGADKFQSGEEDSGSAMVGDRAAWRLSLEVKSLKAAEEEAAMKMSRERARVQLSPV